MILLPFAPAVCSCYRATGRIFFTVFYYPPLDTSINLFPGTAGVPPAVIHHEVDLVPRSTRANALVCGRDARGPREEVDFDSPHRSTRKRRITASRISDLYFLSLLTGMEL